MEVLWIIVALLLIVALAPVAIGTLVYAVTAVIALMQGYGSDR